MEPGADDGHEAGAATVLRAERFVAGGRALARDADGRIVFVEGALPGERVRTASPVRRRGAWHAVVSSADQIEVVAADRVVPPCPRRHEGCGGCDWMHLDPDAQLPAKIEVVRDALRRTGGLADSDLEPDPARERGLGPGGSVPATAYRTTVRVVGRSDGTAGYRRERSHDTVAAEGCLVAHPRLVDLLADMRAPEGVEVTLRCSAATGERVAAWRQPADVGGLPGDVRTGSDAAVHEDVVHTPTSRRPDGRTRLRISARAFFQSGPAAAGLLVDSVVRLAPELGSAGRIVDLYGGGGLFAATVAPPAADVVVVETAAAALRDARANVPDAQVVRSDVARWRPDASDPAADVVIADPPRTGLGRDGVATVVATGAATVALVSCDPVAGARDVAMLTTAGFTHRRTEVLDLFPGTHHVETVTVLVR